MIDEKVLIERLEESRGNICVGKPCNDCKYAKECEAGDKAEEVAVDKTIEIVKDLASEHNNGWIPCEVRLPEDEEKRYIVQRTNGFVDVLFFTKNAYKLDRYDFEEYRGKKKPIFYDYDSEYGFLEVECEAWMSLPAPYKKGE